MTPNDVEDYLARIRAAADDPEMAHSLEDELHVGVLGAIADGAQDPAKLAHAALTSVLIPFPRWYA